MGFPFPVVAGGQNGLQPLSLPKSQPRFGRDAIFERNDRFEAFSDEDVCRQERLERFLEENWEKSGKALASEIAEKSAFLYDQYGRVRGKRAIAPALLAAKAEYYALIRDRKNATPFEKGLVGVKLANALLAADVDTRYAVRLLDRSLGLITRKSGWNPETDAIPPVLVHGFYNRGSHYMNNTLFKESASCVGPLETELSEVGHEGLLLVLRNPIIRFMAPKNLREGIPYLEKAVELARRIDPGKLSVAEYLVAQGEAYHFLSHLNASRFGTDPAFNEKSMNAFRGALDEVTSVKDDATDRHLKLTERLVEVKIDHLCSERHVDSGSSFCLSGPVIGQDYIASLEADGIQRPPETRAEKLDRKLSETPFPLLFMRVFPQELLEKLLEDEK